MTPALAEPAERSQALTRSVWGSPQPGASLQGSSRQLQGQAGREGLPQSLPPTWRSLLEARHQLRRAAQATRSRSKPPPQSTETQVLWVRPTASSMVRPEAGGQVFRSRHGPSELPSQPCPFPSRAAAAEGCDSEVTATAAL